MIRRPPRVTLTDPLIPYPTLFRYEIPSLSVPTTSSPGAFTASWSEIEVAERYELQQRKDGGNWSRIYNGINRSHSISGLVAGTYDYRVRACNVAGCGGFSGIEQTAVMMPPGNPPTLTVPATDNNGAFTASWSRVGTSTGRSEEHTSELQSLMRISYAVFCLNKQQQH